MSRLSVSNGCEVHEERSLDGFRRGLGSRLVSLKISGLDALVGHQRGDRAAKRLRVGNRRAQNDYAKNA
jgi:hypothetical protein